MWAYVCAIWNCRYFWLNLVRIDLRTRYRRSLLGLGWSLLQPVTMTALFCLIVRPLLMPERSFWQCALFFMSGLACWQFIVNVTVNGCQSLIRGEAYIRQYPAPMAIYPLRTALGFAIHFLIVLCLLIIVCCYWHGTIPLLPLFSLVAGVMLFLILGWSLAVLASFANVYFQDTQHLCEVGLQILFYLTPILYGPELLRQKNLGWVLHLNPLVPLFAMVRQPLLEVQNPAPATCLWACSVVCVAFLTACTTLATQQRRIIFYM